DTGFTLQAGQQAFVNVFTARCYRQKMRLIGDNNMLVLVQNFMGKRDSRLGSYFAVITQPLTWHKRRICTNRFTVKPMHFARSNTLTPDGLADKRKLAAKKLQHCAPAVINSRQSNFRGLAGY